LFGLVDSPDNWAGQYVPCPNFDTIFTFVHQVSPQIPARCVASAGTRVHRRVSQAIPAVGGRNLQKTCLARHAARQSFARYHHLHVSIRFHTPSPYPNPNFKPQTPNPKLYTPNHPGLITDLLQVHTLVGVVAFGACTPESERPFILSHVEVMNRALLLPLFFGSAGLKVYLNRASPAVGGIFVGLTAAGLIGQVFGCIIPAYYLYGRNLKRANTLFSYMISKGA